MMEVVSAAKMIKNPHELNKISMGCQLIDHAFGGGLPVHGIHEICGEAGCGKTQFCLSFALQACLPHSMGGLGGSACYLSCGEGQFPVKRLEQLVFSNCSSVVDKNQASRVLERVLIRECPNVDSLFEVIENQLPSLLKRGEVKVVVIDSVAGAFRSDDKFETSKRPGDQNGKTQCQARSRDLFLFSALLRKLSFTYHVPFVVANQATSAGFDQTLEGAVYANALRLLPDLNVRPALGLSWTSSINSRILVTRKRSRPNEGQLETQLNGKAIDGGGGGGEIWKRHALLMMSSCAPLNSIGFTISEVGVRGTQRG